MAFSTPRRVVLGLPSPFPRVCTGGRTLASQPKFLGPKGYQICLAVVLRWRTSVQAPLKNKKRNKIVQLSRKLFPQRLLPHTTSSFCFSFVLFRFGFFFHSSGGYYSDDLGYVGISCKRCPNGSFVAFDKAPGKQTQDCKSCPLGKNKPLILTTVKYILYFIVASGDGLEAIPPI